MVGSIHTQGALSLVLFLRTGKDLGGKACWVALKLDTRVLFRDLIDTKGELDRKDSSLRSTGPHLVDG